MPLHVSETITAAAGGSDFGGRVRVRRISLGLSQDQLAERAAVSARTLREIESGRLRSSRATSVCRVADAMGLEHPDFRDRAGGVDKSATLPASGPLQIAVLGPLTLRRDAREILLGSLKQRTLLGLLALNPGEVVVREDIIDALWDKPPRSCVNLVHTYVARLRRTTGAPVKMTSGGYRLVAGAAVAVDVAAFDRRVASARQAVADGDLASSARAYEHALALWRGRPLAGLGDRARTHPAAVALHRRRTAAALDYADVALAFGASGPAASGLLSVIQDEPLHEGLTARLMVLLAASGQQDRALSVFAGLRDRLARELGVDPGSEIRTALQKVLHQDLPEVGPHRNLEPHVSPVAIGRGKVDEVIVDLVVTARAFMPDGGKFTVTCGNPTASVAVAVTDPGGGVGPQPAGPADEPSSATKGPSTSVGGSIAGGANTEAGDTMHIDTEFGRVTITIELSSGPPPANDPPADRARCDH